MRLRVDTTDALLGTQQVKLRSYNGALAGPVIRVRPGDVLHVHLENMLRAEDEARDCDHGTPHIPCGFNTTNLHTHGLQVSPTGNSDNVFVEIGPGQSFSYEYTIPLDHPAGTFWYHAHKHGSTAMQLGSGLAGALIVEPRDEDRFPLIDDITQRVLLMQQIPYTCKPRGYPLDAEDFWDCAPGDVGMVERVDLFGRDVWPRSGRRTTISGEELPVFTMRPGEVQRWRFIHAGLREALHLAIVPVDCGRQGMDAAQARAWLDLDEAPEGAVELHEIARDGITMHEVRRSRAILLYPGYRSDVLVRLDEVGCYELQDLPQERRTLLGEHEPGSTLARVVVSGQPSASTLPTSAELRRYAPALLPARAADGHDVTLSVVSGVCSDTGRTRFLIDGKEFDPHAPPRLLRLGATEAWTVRSEQIAAGGGGHPFHMHVNPFMALEDERTGEPLLHFKDTIFVPGPEEPGDGCEPAVGAPVRFVARYQRYIGKFVLHCHVLDHEDRGMMELVEIVPPGAGHDAHGR